jgi:hypothetical protein
MTMKKTKMIAALALALSASSAFAYDNTVKAGVIGLWIHSDSPDFTSNGRLFDATACGLDRW